MTKKYIRIIEKFIDQDDELKNNNVLIMKIDRFKRSSDIAVIQEIIAYLRNNKESDSTLEMATELETLMKADTVQPGILSEPVTSSQPVNPAEATLPDEKVPEPATSSLEMATELETPMKPNYAYPPGWPFPTSTQPVKPAEATVSDEKKVPEEKLNPIDNEAEAVTAPERAPGEIFEIPVADAGNVKVHELAAAFDALNGDEYEQFKSNVKLSGQKVPVIVSHGVLLDGRNRLRACKELNMPTKAVEWDGSGGPAELILSLNLYRRHLTASKRAALAVELLPELEKEAAARRGFRTDLREELPASCTGKATDVAGEKVGVSGNYVAQAKKIKEKSPEIFQEVLKGKLSIAKARERIKQLEEPSSPPEPKQLSVSEVIAKLVKLMPNEFNDDISSQSEAKQLALSEIIVKIVGLLPEKFDADIKAIAAKANQFAQQAILGCFPPKEQVVEAGEAEIVENAEEDDGSIKSEEENASRP